MEGPLSSSTTIIPASLPPEILYIIFPLLDPIALISLSQSSRCSRRLIDPQRCHFVRRLLILDPLFEDAAARSSIRHACSGCMRIRGYLHFGNRSILGLFLQKPPPGSRAASQLWN